MMGLAVSSCVAGNRAIEACPPEKCLLTLATLYAHAKRPAALQKYNDVGTLKCQAKAHLVRPRQQLSRWRAAARRGAFARRTGRRVSGNR
jgi:hypothetical protein